MLTSGLIFPARGGSGRYRHPDLVPIGCSNNQHVLLGRDGRLFGLFWPYFWSLGDGVREAVVFSLTDAGEPSVNLEELYPTDHS